MIGVIARRVALILAGLIFIVSVSQVEEDRLYASCKAGSTPPTQTVPVEAQEHDPAFFAQQTLSPEYARMERLGFTHLVGMYNVVSTDRCDRGTPATVELRSFKIIETDAKTGKTEVVQTIAFDDAAWANPHGLEYTLFYRKPWFTSGVPAHQPIVVAREGGVYWINAQFVPKAIIHGWTKPRVEAKRNRRYAIEVEVRVSQGARLQLGMDYWRGSAVNYNGWSEGCRTSNNCQAWLSDWLGDTAGQFITWRVPVW